MGKCKSCGKFGFFLRLNQNGLCSECAAKKSAALKRSSSSVKKISANLTRMQKEQELADQQIARLNKAREQYGPSKDYDSLIEVYEQVFSEKNSWNTCSHKLKLSEYYLKAGRNNDSWKLLNSLVTEFPNEIARIRKLQYKQLKSEKKYPEALKMLFIYKFDDYKSYTSWQASHLEDFKKDAVTLGKKIKLSESDIADLTDILGKSVRSSKCDERMASERFKEWYSKLK